MPYWRRTVADLSNQDTRRRHDVLRACEGYKFDRFLKWPEVEFSTKGFQAPAACCSTGDGSYQLRTYGSSSPIPRPRQPSELLPQAVMKGELHGTRNSLGLISRGNPRETSHESEAELTFQRFFFPVLFHNTSERLFSPPQIPRLLRLNPNPLSAS